MLAHCRELTCPNESVRRTFPSSAAEYPPAPRRMSSARDSVTRCRIFRMSRHREVIVTGRHFPRFCDTPTRIQHPYKVQLFRTERNGGCVRRSRTPPHAHRRSSARHATAVLYRFSSIHGQIPSGYEPHLSQHPIRREDPCRTGYDMLYQLAFFTPGIRPAEAISRNWIRLIPNWRI